MPQTGIVTTSSADQRPNVCTSESAVGLNTQNINCFPREGIWLRGESYEIMKYKNQSVNAV